MLDLNTTAKMAYTRKPMEKTSPIKPQETHIAPGKFEGSTTMHVSRAVYCSDRTANELVCLGNGGARWPLQAN